MLLLAMAGMVKAQQVYVSIPPLKYAAEQLLGENVGVVLAPGQNPHTYAPSARQISKLSQAEVLFTTGVPFERLLLDRLNQVAPDIDIIKTDAHLTKRTFSEEVGHVHIEECQHGDWDPHVWLSPLLYAQQVEVMAEVFKEYYPEKSSSIDQKLAELHAELKELHEELKQMLSVADGQTIMVYHPAFGYFAEAYGFKQLAVELDGKEPTPKQLAHLIQHAQELGVQVLFVQKQFPASTAKAIADAIDGTVVPLDPLSADYVNNMREIGQRISEGKAH